MHVVFSMEVEVIAQNDPILLDGIKNRCFLVLIRKVPCRYLLVLTILN